VNVKDNIHFPARECIQDIPTETLVWGLLYNAMRQTPPAIFPLCKEAEEKILFLEKLTRAS